MPISSGGCRFNTEYRQQNNKEAYYSLTLVPGYDKLNLNNLSPVDKIKGSVLNSM